MTHEEKYIKYKLKYLKLQQSGGAFPFTFASNSFTIMAELGGDTLERVNERRSKLGLSKIISPLHITLLQIFVNPYHPCAHIFREDSLFDEVHKSYRQHLDTKLELESKCQSGKGGMWDFLGHDINNKFWARVYHIDKSYHDMIKAFRMAFYLKINVLLSKSKCNGITLIEKKNMTNPKNQNDISNFAYYGNKHNGDVLYAINTDYYVGADNWKPHISIFSVKDLSGNNAMYSELTNPKNSNESKTILIKKTIGNVKPISSIHFGDIKGYNSFSKLVVSYRSLVKKTDISTKIFDISK
jgi:hypothetical protein